MSGPSFSNIDLWLFELSEGNLNSAQVEQLEMFLLQNPDIDIDRDVWNMAKIKPSNDIFPNQEELERKRRPIAWFYISSAASIALLIGTSVFTIPNSPLDKQTQLIAKIQHQDVVIEMLKNEISEIKQSKNSLLVEDLKRAEEVGRSVTTKKMNSSESSVTDNNGVEETQNNSTFSKVNNNSLLNSASDSRTAIINSIKHGSFSRQDLNSSENTKRNETKLTKPVEELQVLDDKDYVLASRTKREVSFTNFKAPNNYKKSVKSKFSKFSRVIRRMANNPVALKNYRDPSYHVPGMLPNDINFSSTGGMLRTRVQSISRLQWYGQGNEQLTNQLAIDGYSYGLRGGVGLQLNHAYYSNGGVQVADVALTYSSKLSLNSVVSFEPSIRFKMGNKRLDADKMKGSGYVEIDRGNVSEYYPDNTSPIGNSLWYKDLGIGLMMNTEWFYVGAQIDNIFRHEDNMFSNDINNANRVGQHIIVSAGTDWVNKKENLSFSPYIVYQKKERLSEAWLGANFRYNWIVVGAGISSLLDPAASVGLKFKRFALTYNADYTISNMTNKRSLSHQVSIKFIGKPSRIGRRILNL